MRFLGYAVSAAGIRPLPEKVEAIRNFPRPETVQELRRFLGMVNFYRRFIPTAARIQAPLNAALQGRVKGRSPVEWSEERQRAFDECKESVVQAALLAHPKMSAPLAIFTDASDFTLEAALQQQTDEGWQPLAFFTKKLSSAQRKYSTYDRELLAIYSAVKHFQYMVEGRQFVVYTDHKPLTFAFAQKSESHSPRQFRYLDLVGQFTTDVRHVSGKDNIVADALSRVAEISRALDFNELAKSQQDDGELRLFSGPNTALELKKVRWLGGDADLYCDVSTDALRPFVTVPFRKQAFDSVHGLAHPGIEATTKLVTARFVWPEIRKDCKTWAQSCIQCQRAKVSRHVSAPVGQFVPPSTRFEHVHVDIVGPLPISRGFRYLLTCVDRFTR